MTTFVRFRRGETIAFALQCTMGDPLSVTSISADVRATTNGQLVNPAAPGSAQAAVTFYPATSYGPAFWAVVIAAADSYGIAAGRYAIDAQLVIGSDVVFTDPLVLIIDEPATIPAAPAQTGFGAPWINSAPTSGNGAMTLQWAGRIGPCMEPPLAAIIGLPSPNVDALAATVAKLAAQVATLVAGGAVAAPGTLDFTQNGNPLSDAL